MTNATTKNFLQVMAEFKWPDPVPISYRLYYNDDGTPKCYTMEDLPGKYIEVDQDTYIKRLWNVLVVDGKLQIIPPSVTVYKLKPNNSLGVCCDARDVCVVVGQDQPGIKWTRTTNETH